MEVSFICGGRVEDGTGHFPDRIKKKGQKMGYRAVNGEKFRQLRDINGLTQQELADMMNAVLGKETIDARNIRRYEQNGGANIKYLKAAAKIFVVDYTDLLAPELPIHAREFSITYITLRNDFERHLLYQSFELYKTFFPRENECPDPEDVERYIEQSYIDNDPCKEIYAVLHKGDMVIGFYWATVYPNFTWAIAQNIGILEGYRTLDRSKKFFNEFEDYIMGKFDVKGLIFDMELVDLPLWKEVLEKAEFIDFDERVASYLRAMRRIYLYQNNRAYVVLNRHKLPLAYWQPYWDDDLKSFGIPMVLMIKSRSITREKILLQELLESIYGMYGDASEQCDEKPPNHLEFIEELKHRSESEAAEGWAIEKLPSSLFKNMYKLILRGKKEAPDIWINL